MRSRRALAALWAILSLAALLLLLPTWPTPERVPTHWGGGGPDGFTSGPAFLSTIMTTVVISVIAAAATGVLQRVLPPAWARWIVSIAAALGWGAVVVYTVTVWRTEVDGAGSVADLWAAVGIVAGLVAGWVAHVIHGKRIPSEAELAALVPERSRTQAIRGRAVQVVVPWETEMTSRTLQVIGWGVAGIFLLLLGWLWWEGSSALMLAVVAITGLGTSVIALAWSHIALRVDSDALTITSQVLPVRVSRVPVEQVAGVDVQDLDPMKWGGVGLRPLPDRTAYIVDAGPGIVIYTRDGRRLALQITEGDQSARAGARTLLRAAGQRLGETASS